jgi:hypothetical protein
MNADQKSEIQISQFDRFKELVTNLVSVPKSEIVEEDKKERKQKNKRLNKKNETRGKSPAVRLGFKHSI